MKFVLTIFLITRLVIINFVITNVKITKFIMPDLSILMPVEQQTSN